VSVSDSDADEAAGLVTGKHPATAKETLMQRIIFLIVALLFCSTLQSSGAFGQDRETPEERCLGWFLEKVTEEPDWDDEIDQCMGNEAYVFVTVLGSSVLSEGRAADASDFCSVSVTIALDGSRMEEWRHKPPPGVNCMGEIQAHVYSELSSTITIQKGYNKLKTDAYVETVSSVTPNARCEVTLERETGSKHVATVKIPFGPFTVAVKLSLETGTGSWTEDDDNDFPGEGTGDYFMTKVKCKVIENSLHSNGGWLSYVFARCSDSIEGRGWVSQTLTHKLIEDEE